MTGSPDPLTLLCVEKQDHFNNLAQAGNEKIAASVDGTLTEFSTFSAYKSLEGTQLRLLSRLQQLVANQTTFTALTTSGSVYTWGDARYESCLARKPSEACEAATPCLVEDLLDLPTGRIVQLASGGYTTAALTSGNDLYLWGGRPGQPKLLDGMEDFPTPVDLEGVDWADVGVGATHIIALSTDGKVWVAGENSNGQLGLGATIDISREWKEVKLSLEGKTVSKIYAGYKNSFLLIE